MSCCCCSFASDPSFPVLCCFAAAARHVSYPGPAVWLASICH
jgi:hypothetical protein